MPSPDNFMAEADFLSDLRKLIARYESEFPMLGHVEIIGCLQVESAMLANELVEGCKTCDGKS